MVLLSRFHSLTTRVDAFSARVESRHPAELSCRPGCDGCCRTRLTVTAVEAAAITTWAAELAPAERASLAAAARAAAPDRCPALDETGRCRIYPARPLVCRSHGLPIRMRDRRGLPVIQSCEKTFASRGPAAADPDCILDQELVSTMRALVDREFAAAAGHAPTGVTILAQTDPRSRWLGGLRLRRLAAEIPMRELRQKNGLRVLK